MVATVLTSRAVWDLDQSLLHEPLDIVLLKKPVVSRPLHGVPSSPVICSPNSIAHIPVPITVG